MTETGNAVTCQWCGLTHFGLRCPSVKAIEFFSDGATKRVEFLTPADITPVIERAPGTVTIPDTASPGPWWPNITWTGGTGVSCN